MSDQVNSPDTENDSNLHLSSPNDETEKTNHSDDPVDLKEEPVGDQGASSPDNSEKNSEDENDHADTGITDYEAVFGDMQSSDEDSSAEENPEEVESDYEQEAKKNLRKIVEKKKRQKTKKDKSKEPPKKRRKLAVDKETERAAKKRAAEEKKLEEKLKIVRGVMDRMKEAYDADLVNMEANRPAIKKLRLLTEIERTVPSSNLQKQFIDCHVLDEFGKWMKPLPDKSLPDLQIRKVILKILMKLNTSNISLEILKDSGVGKFVHLYSIHPKETRENKELAERILNLWMDLDRFSSTVRSSR
uniref:TFIIS N-terminal domain-containing protein n=1 Tax=Vannella robusta TaxID=1487602 RepID=A0A7S4HRI6_9EUKA